MSWPSDADIERERIRKSIAEADAACAEHMIAGLGGTMPENDPALDPINHAELRLKGKLPRKPSALPCQQV